MRCKFPDRDLAQRLDQTICRYKGHPYYVRYAGKNMLYLYELTKRDKDVAFTINSEDVSFDVSSPPLGYYQNGKNAVYVSRRPSRMYKQGLSVDAMNFRYLPGSTYRDPYQLYSKSFEQMIIGEYISLDDAIIELRRSDVDKELCVSRDIALRWNAKLQLIFVFFKNDEVGWMTPGTNTVVIPTNELAWVISQNLAGYNWEVR